MAELKAGVGQPFDATTPRVNSRNSGNSAISVSVVGEFVQWNEEAIARCTLLTPQVRKLSLSFALSVSLCLQATLLATYVCLFYHNLTTFLVMGFMIYFSLSAGYFIGNICEGYLPLLA